MNSEKKLLKKKILITGAGSGIGRATAIELAAAGADIAINYRPGKEGEVNAQVTAEKICQEVRGAGCQSLLVPADVSQEEDVCRMFKEIMDEWGHLDILINNAGIQRKKESHLVSLEEFNEVFSTNAVATFLCSREAIKIFLMKDIKGVIINNTSVHQLIPKPQYLSYSMSKGAIQNLTRTLALEYAHKGIRINNVAPGAIITPINPWAGDEEKKSNIRKHIPMGEVGRARQIARGMLYLASEDSDYVTGQTLFIDGGLTLYPDFGEDWSSG